ncbi:MAG: hypothetical protein KJZ93_20325 [Caldilineaceae bacterium]|nr:hypothetical protein [Caldilineaceae bacterium]
MALIWAQLGKAIAGQQNTLTQAITQREAALDSAGAAMTHASESFFVGRRTRTRATVNTYLSEADRLVQIYFALRIEESCAELIGRLQEWVDRQQQQLQNAQNKMRHARGWLQQRTAELSHPVPAAYEISLAEPPLVEHLFTTYRGSTEADVQAFLAAAGDPLAWADITADELADTLLRTAARAFHPISQITVEDVLRQFHPDRSPQYWQSLLQELAAGAWNLDRSLLSAGGAGLPHQLILGVPDAGQTFFGGSDLTLVSTNDPERIVALRTIYGVSFDALKPAVLWQRAYANAAGSLPLHVLSGFQSDDERARQRFALGEIFAYIQGSENRFSYHPEDHLEEAISLGHGLRNALHSFQQEKGLAARVAARAEGWIAAHGVNQALRQIDDYVNRPTRDEIRKTLQRAARSYAEKLRRNHSATGEN